MRNLIKISCFFLWAGGQLALGQVNTRETPVDDEHDPKVHFARAEDMRKKEQFLEAVNEYDKAITFDPKNYKYMYARANCYFEVKDTEHAILSLLMAIDVNPDFTPGYVLLAKCYEHNKDHHNMIKYLDLAFLKDNDPQRKMGYKMRAIKALVDHGEKEEALPYIREAEKLEPENLGLLYYDAHLNNILGHYAAAKTKLEIAVQKMTTKDPLEVAKFYYELGYAYNHLGEFEKSGIAFEKADYGPYKSKVAMLSPGFYCNAAACYMKINRFSEAKKDIEIALKIQHDFSLGHAMMAEISVVLADQNKAIAEYQKALENEKIPKKRAHYFLELAQLQLYCGKYTDALFSIEEYVKFDHTDHNGLFLKASILYLKGDQYKAIDALEEIVHFPKLSVEMQAKYNFALGLIYKEIKKNELAKVVLKRALFGPYKALVQIQYDEIVDGEGSKHN